MRPASAGASWPWAQAYPSHRSILTLDIEGFSDVHRDDSARSSMREGFYRVLHEALEGAGVPQASCQYEDRGDGAILLISPTVPKVLLLDPLLSCLRAALSEHNRRVLMAQRFRLRCAIHAGEVASDAHGFSGSDLITACRMLDAPELRSALRNSAGELAVMVSDLIYDGTIRHRFRGIDPVEYQPVYLQVKNSRIRAWIHLPGVTAVQSVVSGRLGDSPHQLPPAKRGFVGRERELSALDQVSRDVAVIVGPPGVGKTALAVYWAHRVGHRYPDGQLYADLGGPANPVGPAGTILRFLKSLGVPAEGVPADTVEQAALFRELTVDKRLLVVLDNAESASDVRLMLPARATSLTVVTGPSRLGSLSADRAELIALGPLSRRDGMKLLTHCVGKSRIAAEAALAGQLVGLCGGLPIALRVVGARLATRPRWTMQRAVADLTDERRRLDRLTFGNELSVQAVFDVSYQALPGSAARLYRLLSLHPGHSFDVGAAAAVVECSTLDTERQLEDLLNANLLDEPRAGRYRFHDLVQLHARQRAEAEETVEERAAAVRRVLDWHTCTQR